MKVFLSWSGPLSQKIADSFYRLLPCVLQSVSVFSSKHDIETGTRWSQELSEKLNESSFGIIFLTPDNIDSNWLHFEAGALTKHSSGRACCVLLDSLTAVDVPEPLSQFQSREFEEAEIRTLYSEINQKLESPLSSENFNTLFDKFWIDIEEDYLEAIHFETKNTDKSPKKSEYDLLEEILLRVRNLNFESTLSGTVLPSVTSEVLDRAVTFDSLAWYTLWKFPGTEVSSRLQEILLRDLLGSNYRTISKIDDAVNRAENAVDVYAKEAPEIFKFGTDRITKSLGFVDKDFKVRHGFSRKTLDAFVRYQHLVKK